MSLASWPILAQAHAGESGALHVEEHGAATGHEEAPHGDEHGGEHGEGMVHLPTVTGLINNPTVTTYENFLYGGLWMGLLLILLATAARNLKLVPTSRGQLFTEFLVQGLNDFVHGNLGAHAKPFVVFIGSMFLFIWINNASGQVPLMKPITADFHTTFALGLCVFFVVQWHGIRSLGFGGWLGHLAGLPDAPLWMAPLNFFLHTVGELVKPLSLALRLFGNIFGEEMLVTAFVGLGAAIFLPLHFPFYFLGLLVGFVQALVFTLLACAYIGSMSHHHADHGDEHAHDAHEASHLSGVPGVPEGTIQTAAAH